MDLYKEKEHKAPKYLIQGQGEWRDKDGSMYDIKFISYPPTNNGKHVYIDGNDGSISHRSLEEGKILSFKASHTKSIDDINDSTIVCDQTEEPDIPKQLLVLIGIIYFIVVPLVVFTTI